MNKKMKTVLTSLVTSFTCLVAQAQDSPFPNSTWKIEPAAAEDHFILRKAQKLNLPDEQAKFHYIQFDNEKHFKTGNDCYGMNGNYDEEDEQKIRFQEGIAGMAGDCVAPKSLVGTYAYEVFSNRIALRPVYEANEGTNEEEDYNSADVADAAVEEAAKDVEQAATKKRKGKR